MAGLRSLQERSEVLEGGNSNTIENNFTDAAETVNSLNTKQNALLGADFDFSKILGLASTGSFDDLIAPLSIFVSVLDNLAAIHSFVAVVAIPFKAIVNIELQRQGNDRRALVLLNQMADMMSQLTELSSTAPNETEETGIAGILQKMKSGIDDCGNMIDCYLKQKVIIRIVKSLAWQEKFESFAQMFSELKTSLNDAMLVIVHRSTRKINDRTKASDGKLDRVLVLLRKRTDLENKIARFIQRHGGIDRCLEEDSIVQGLITVSEKKITDPFPSVDYRTEPVIMPYDDYGRQWSRNIPTARFADGNGDNVYGLSQIPGEINTGYMGYYGSRDARTWYSPAAQTGPVPSAYPSVVRPVSQSEALRRPSEYPPPIPGVTQPDQYVDLGLVTQCREDIVVALNTGIGALLQNHTVIWRLKLDHQTAVITKEIRMNTSRILQKLDAGPHNRVSDPHIRTIWATEKWKGSVSGPMFVQAVWDYMGDCIGSPSLPELVCDRWTLEFFGPSYRKALLEAIDIDHSGYVSVQEINKFTETKPAGYTLPVWFAYSAVRSSYEAVHYRKEILNSIGALNRSVAEGRVAPAIVRSVKEYLSTVNNIVLEGLVNPLVVPPSRIRDIQGCGPLYVPLRSRTRERESDLAEKLSKARWEIDGPAALSAIIGEGPLEHHLLPLLYVFVNHYAESATKQIVSEGETRNFGTGKETILKIAELVDDRVFYLREYLGPFEYFTFACGLFSSWRTVIPDVDPLPTLSSERPDNAVHIVEKSAIPGSYPIVVPPVFPPPVVVVEPPPPEMVYLPSPSARPLGIKNTSPPWSPPSRPSFFSRIKRRFT
ncbi:uncharacterized protein EI90DRAFT_3045103 [Cantharellus anzutake]|uniref:uncharacterized protein n=1 Tax=Cantharellus anzutake TaxID=1750568 RepID=UPI001905F0C7|nr:uncharacterized protein EI90DRAFT_3045103 [Cantharellus anzutake]KAF8336266.1 hypothetical protein EI90DRAFT_3045103 [Cantharellus anzutake]